MFLLLLACTGSSEDSACSTSTWYLDADGDGFGDAGRTLEACEQPIGYLEDATDCDDLEASVYPGALEVCDGMDTDCDGLEDFEDDSLDDSELPTWHVDADGDGYGDADDPGIEACLGPDGSVPNSEDCDDGDAAVSPADNEICDGIDNDCDGLVDDEDEVLAASLTRWFEDVDSDGYGTGEPQALCVQPEGWVEAEGDCDDADAARYPGAPEVCGDGLVQDCEGDEASALAECWWQPTTDPEDDVDGRLGPSEEYIYWSSQLSDIDGDGTEDLVVAHGWHYDEDYDKGQIYVHLGPISEDSAFEGDFQLTGSDTMASSVGLGDVDGDGQDDLLIGEPGNDEDSSNAGRAFLVLGPVTAGVEADELSVLEIRGLGSNDQLGTGAAILEDLNGDGGGDLALGAIFDDVGASNGGTVWLLDGDLRGSAEVSTDAFASFYAEDSSTYLGNNRTIAASDLDGDGVADLALGAWRGSPYGQSDEGDEEYFGWEGYVAVFQGPVSGSMSTVDADATLLGHQSAASYLGAFVETGFDWDGDGLDDLATGAPQVESTEDEDEDAGAFYLMTAAPSGDVDLTAAHLVVRGVGDQRVGGEVSVADLDGDGELDLLIGSGYGYASSNSASQAHGEGAWLFYGPLSGSLSTEDAETWFEGEDLGSDVHLLPDADGGAGQVAVSSKVWSETGFLLFDAPAY